ncbi:MAG TPA: hypothetical protein VGX00_08570 [Thermoplasmata archaeon]|nr:hypothetical protein [Thermoplasmata archaeon]
MVGSSQADASVVREDKSKEPAWIREGRQGLLGAHWSWTAGLVMVLVIVAILTGVDTWVARTIGLAALDQTLQAEAEAVVAIATVIGGSYAALTILTPGAKEP